MTGFTPVHAVIGGALIALALSILLVATGRLAGLSAVFAGLLSPVRGDWAWRAWFVVGMLATGAIFRVAEPSTFDAGARVPLPILALAGVLVGAGTRLGSGCTSGHGLCGMSRGSRRSIAATLVFFGIGVATATLAGTVLR